MKKILSVSGQEIGLINMPLLEYTYDYEIY